MASNKPLVIQLTKDVGAWPKGTELGVEKESDAAKTYGDTYKVVGYQDGGAYEAPAPAASEPDDGKGA